MTSRHSGPPLGNRFARRLDLRKAGFSLVEVVLAIGVVAFAFVALFGLLPAGLSTFRQALDNSLGSQIVQRLVNEAQQTDFPTLIATPTGPLRYFDDQGNEVGAIADSIYTAEVSVAPTTKLPDTRPDPTPSLATVTVKLANNPGRNPSPFAATSKIRYATYTALIAKNQ
jgi:uncharacterized protein (TIGR02598 family)